MSERITHFDTLREAVDGLRGLSTALSLASEVSVIDHATATTIFWDYIDHIGEQMGEEFRQQAVENFLRDINK